MIFGNFEKLGWKWLEVPTENLEDSTIKIIYYIKTEIIEKGVKFHELRYQRMKLLASGIFYYASA